MVFLAVLGAGSTWLEVKRLAVVRRAPKAPFVNLRDMRCSMLIRYFSYF